MKKDQSALDIRTKKTYRLIFALLLLIMAISIIGLLIIDHQIETAGSTTTLEFWHDLFGNILGAAVGAALVDVVLDFTSKDEKEDGIQKSIVNALCPPDMGSEPPMIAKLFSQSEFEAFLKNGLSAYGRNSATGTGILDYYKENCLQVRRSEVYNIDIYPNKIHQNYRHTGVFLRPADRNMELRLFLIFANTKVVRGELDKYLSDTTYAYREEFDSPAFEKEIAQKAAEVEAADAKSREQKMRELFEAMELELIIYENEQQDEEDGYRVPFDEVSIKLCRNSHGDPFGLHIAAKVPEKYIFDEKSGANEYYEGSGYIHFISQVEITYPAKKGHNLFPIVYSRIAVSPSFTVSFMNFDKIDVKFFPFLSFNTSKAANRYDGLVRETNKSYHFTTTRTIFPRSGVAFSWIIPEDA